MRLASDPHPFQLGMPGSQPFLICIPGCPKTAWQNAQRRLCLIYPAIDERAKSALRRAAYELI